MTSSPNEKRVAMIQSSYIPWKGYFDIINSVDEFLLYDHVQYTRRDWRSRNQIKTSQGLQWLTIPIQVKHKSTQRICDAETSEPGWNEKHWKTIEQNYSRAECFAEYREQFRELYLGLRETRLSQINWRFITAICQILGITTPIRWSMDFDVEGDATEQVVAYCRRLGATTYISGPRARAYIDAGCFERAGIRLEYFDYEGYPTYRQLYGEFRHQVSVIDLLFNEGRSAPQFMKGYARDSGGPKA